MQTPSTTPAPSADEIIHHLSDGYHIVSLGDEASLQGERAAMSPGIGLEPPKAYGDDHLVYLSLRNSLNEPLATIEVVRDGIGCNLFSIASAGGELPADELLSILQPFLKLYGFTLGETPAELGVILDDEGRLHRIDDLPENLVVSRDTDLCLEDGGKLGLKAGMTIWGSLELYADDLLELPARMRVGEYLDLTGTKISSLTADLKVGLYIDITGTEIRELPEGFQPTRIRSRGMDVILPVSPKIGHGE